MSILDRLTIDGKTLDGEIRGRVTAAKLVRTMDGASSLELTLDDSDRVLLRSGLLDRSGKPTRRQRHLADFDQAAWSRFGVSRLVVDGWFTRLAGVSKTGNQLTLTFEDELAALMRAQTKAIKSGRQSQNYPSGTQTRAMFIGMLLFIARRQVGFAMFFSPEESVRQTVKKTPVKDDPARQKGFARNARLTIKGRDATSEQRRNLTTSMKVADELRAGDRAVLAMLVAGIGESNFRVVPNLQGSVYGGVFQGKYRADGNGPANFDINDTAGMARSFLLGGKGFQAGGAIKLAGDPDLTPGDIATKVEASGKAGSFYQAWIDEAQAILEAWGGTDRVVTSRERYEYRAGGNRDGVQHNYWDDARELAREVGWRLWADSNQLWYVSDEWLFQRQPAFHVDEQDSWVLDFGFDADIGMPVAELTCRLLASEWATPPGVTVQVDNAGPVSGRWLLWESEANLDGTVDVTLHRPAPKRKEPASKLRPPRRLPATTDDRLDNGLAYPLAAHGTFIGGVAAHKGRAWGNWQSDNAVDIGVPVGTPVYAVDDGTIVKLGGSYDHTGLSNPNGFNVTLKTKNNTWWYTHLRRREPLKVGDRVAAGQLLGESGAANGVKHLHIASEKGDPEKLLGVKDT